MLYNLLAKLGAYLVEKFYIYKGPTYTVRLGRLDKNKWPKPDIRRQRAMVSSKFPIESYYEI